MKICGYNLNCFETRGTKMIGGVFGMLPSIAPCGVLLKNADIE